MQKNTDVKRKPRNQCMSKMRGSVKKDKPQKKKQTEILEEGLQQHDVDIRYPSFLSLINS